LDAFPVRTLRTSITRRHRFCGKGAPLGSTASTVIVGTGIISLALVGELAAADERANQIGKYNSWRMAAGIIGTIGAGVLYDAFGFDPIFAVLVVLFVIALLGV